MLKLKINKKDVEILEQEEFVRGTVGANLGITAIDEYWLSEEMLNEIAPPELLEGEANIVGFKIAFVFKRCGEKAIEKTLIEEYAESNTNLKTLNLVDDETETISIPHEMFTESGSFKIGFYTKITYVKSEEDYNNKNYNYLITPTLWSDKIKVRYGTDTDGANGSAEPTYTPSELEEVKQEISGKQDKLTAGKNITITDDNVISADGGKADQTYSATSTNAQSGKAVAEAFNTERVVRKPSMEPTLGTSRDYIYFFREPQAPFIHGEWDMTEQYANGPYLQQLEIFNMSEDDFANCVPVRDKGNIKVPYNVYGGFASGKQDEHAAALGELKWVQNQLTDNISQVNSQLNDSISLLSNLVNAKNITTVGVQANCKYTFDWNAMYFFKSNSGKADITLLDSDGNNIIGTLKTSYGVLILPKESFVRSEWSISADSTKYDIADGNHKQTQLHGLFAGMTDKTALVTTDKIQMLQFDLEPDKTVSVTPSAESVIVYKIKF